MSRRNGYQRFGIFVRLSYYISREQKGSSNGHDIIQKLAVLKMEPVKLENGKMIASRIGAYDFIECSAKTKECVGKVLEAAGLATINYKRSVKKKRCSLL